jgi:hypothetical protein
MCRLLIVMAMMLSLYGCGGAMQGKSEESWNSWMGTTKDERVREQGIPTRCHTFKSGGEACEWPIVWGPSMSGTITLSFDAKGTACQWAYKDAYGEQRSTQHCP